MDHKRNKLLAGKITFFIGLIVLAYLVSKVTALVSLPAWVAAFLIFAGTKLLYDLIFALFGKGRKFLFFEDYLREILVFFVVAAICVAGFTVAETYLGGKVWIPLLAAGLVFIWR